MLLLITQCLQLAMYVFLFFYPVCEKATVAKQKMSKKRLKRTSVLLQKLIIKVLNGLKRIFIPNQASSLFDQPEAG